MLDLPREELIQKVDRFVDGRSAALRDDSFIFGLSQPASLWLLAIEADDHA